MVTNLIAYLSTFASSPWIYAQPSSTNALVGQSVQFNVAIGGYPPPVDQWQVSADNGQTWTNLSDSALYTGTATQTLTITAVTTALNGDQYRCVATDASGSVTSTAATLSERETPVFTTQPVSQTVGLGIVANFTAAAAAIPVATYWWQVSTDGGNSWEILNDLGPYIGSQTATLTIVGVTAVMNGYQYRCLASNSVQDNVASNAAILTITMAIPSGSLWGLGNNSDGDLGDPAKLVQVEDVRVGVGQRPPALVESIGCDIAGHPVVTLPADPVLRSDATPSSSHRVGFARLVIGPNDQHRGGVDEGFCSKGSFHGGKGCKLNPVCCQASGGN